MSRREFEQQLIERGFPTEKTLYGYGRADVPVLQYGGIINKETERRRAYGMIGFLGKRGYLSTLMRKGAVRIDGNTHAGGMRGAHAIKEVGQMVRTVVEYGNGTGNHVQVDMHKMEVRLDTEGIKILNDVLAESQKGKMN